MNLRGAVSRLMLARLRSWDAGSATRPDYIVTLSRYIARRIAKCWGRGSVVVYPPVAVDRFGLQATKSKHYVTASRMVPYKRIPLIVKAFAQMPERELVVIGDGPDWKRCVAEAKGCANIKLMGYQSHEVLVRELQHARAFLFAAEEDFGIAPLEAQACGTPVIAYGRGGASETILPGETGAFFDRQDVASICQAVEAFEQGSGFDPARCRRQAERFSSANFQAGMAVALSEACAGVRTDQPAEPRVWGGGAWLASR
ncbi:MAG: glycosyltransferase [Planctomycetota bacterium]|nr:glycosyltransferase [Planctomycetota bacterium]